MVSHFYYFPPRDRGGLSLPQYAAAHSAEHVIQAACGHLQVGHLAQFMEAASPPRFHANLWNASGACDCCDARAASRATRVLRRCAVVGLTEEFDAFLGAVRRIFPSLPRDWRSALNTTVNLGHSSRPGEDDWSAAPEGLLAQLRAGLAADEELYATARTIAHAAVSN